MRVLSLLLVVVAWQAVAPSQAASGSGSGCGSVQTASACPPPCIVTPVPCVVPRPPAVVDVAAVSVAPAGSVAAAGSGLPATGASVRLRLMGGLSVLMVLTGVGLLVLRRRPHA